MVQLAPFIMTKKEIVFPFIIFALTIAFAVVSFLLFLSGGKSAKWLARKIKLGALLLTLNAFTPGTAQEIEVSCYDIAEENVMLLKTEQTELIFKSKSPKVVEAIIDFRTSENYSFCQVDEGNKEIQSGKITALDGKFDEWKEDVEIQLKNDLKAEKYFLLLFDVAVNE